jgi:hypothetical protein
MSWRTGSKLFIELWPLIEKNVTNGELRVEFTAQLLKLFVDWDMDTFDVEDVHADVRAAMRKAKLPLATPERWGNDPNRS